jgi:hypothetical protein
MSPDESDVEPVSEMIKDKPKRSFRDPSLLILAGFLIIGGSIWQLFRLTDIVPFLPEEQAFIFVTQTVEGFYLALILGSLLFVSSAVMLLVNQQIGAVIGLICSGIGFFIPGSGFFIGPILGLIAGFDILMVSKPPSVGDPNEVL